MILSEGVAPSKYQFVLVGNPFTGVVSSFNTITSFTQTLGGENVAVGEGLMVQFSTVRSLVQPVAVTTFNDTFFTPLVVYTLVFALAGNIVSGTVPSLKSQIAHFN